MNRVDELLNELHHSCSTPNISRAEIKKSMKKLLLWLNEPLNNTDMNSQTIDHFIGLNIVSGEKWDSLPKDLQDILFDMGGTLHDTHNSPQVAENFNSTPHQLLDRLNRLP